MKDTKEKNPLFDFIKILFTNTKEYGKLKNNQKNKHFFLFNRFCSISYPIQANAFNNIKISAVEVIDYWQLSLRKKYNGTIPSWIWTKTIKKEKVKEENKYKEEILDFIKDKYQLSNREINELIEFFPLKFKQFYKDIESLMS